MTFTCIICYNHKKWGIILGKKDSITKSYMGNSLRFADLFNGYCFAGEARISPHELKDMDSASIVIPYSKDGAIFPTQKARDVLKVLVKTDGRAAYCILGVENQSEVHTAMPVRNMLYDAMTMAEQINAITNYHKEKHEYGCSNVEFLSGFHENDVLLPVVTLVIYWGADEWNAPISLRDMYPKNIDKTLLQYSPDYHINLVSPALLDDDVLDFFKSDLREMLKFIKYSKNKQRMMELVTGDPKYKSLDREAAQAISICSSVELSIPEGKERINMCQAIEDMKADARNEGRVDAQLTSIRNLMKNKGWTAQEAMDALMISADEQAQYISMIRHTQ